MKIECLKVGKLECNTYILEIDGRVLVIDPGDDGDEIISKIGKRKVEGIIITHYHFDHIGALDLLINKYNVISYDRNNLSEDKNRILDFTFEVIYTPGHKDDAITLYFPEDKVMFCGDFIFNGGIGRCDLDGGSEEEMFNSLKRISKYDDDILVYPGHGEETYLGREKILWEEIWKK